jgi:hypothetical protein
MFVPGVIFAMEMTPLEGGVGLEGVIGLFLGGVVGGGVILTIIMLVILCWKGIHD